MVLKRGVFYIIICYFSPIEELKDDPVLLQKVQTLLAEGNSDVVAYAAQLGDDYVIREYLKTSPNEVLVHYYNIVMSNVSLNNYTYVW